LYEADAQGIVDEALIDDVGMRLLARCQSILAATEAHAGRAPCPRCGQRISHNWDKNKLISCPDCGWQTTWGAYFKTYQDKQLHGGGAVHAFQTYVEQYMCARTPRERMLLIDRLIHVFHHELTHNPTRPAACNLIGGTITEVADFLDTLSYGESSTSGVTEEYRTWLSKAEAGAWFRSILSNVRDRRQRTGD